MTPTEIIERDLGKPSYAELVADNVRLHKELEEAKAKNKMVQIEVIATDVYNGQLLMGQEISIGHTQWLVLRDQARLDGLRHGSFTDPEVHRVRRGIEVITCEELLTASPTADTVE